MNKVMKDTKTSGRLQVFFEDPFWIGIFERQENGKLSVCKVTFGKEPKDYEIWEFILKNYDRLSFSPTVGVEKQQKEHVNPKRLQRDAKKQIENVGIGTKSQQALQLAREMNKQERAVRTKQQKEEEEQFQYELRQQKKKEKHKGR